MTSSPSARWSASQAHAWHRAQPLALGANYVPAGAINQLDMWQAETFDPARINLELGWARSLGMNAMRVFLHDLLWQQDAPGFKQRIAQYLGIAQRHGIRSMFVLFDSCWDPQPRLGPQRAPMPGVHNSGWVQGPGAVALGDAASVPRLKAYVEDIVNHFGQDERVWCWDVWNEPDNQGGGMGFYTPHELPDKLARVAALLPQVFAWARAAGATQPLTSGVWIGDDWRPGAPGLNDIQRCQLGESDVISFHDYNWPEVFERRVAQLQAHGRPLVCTEYVARGNGSTFDACLPLAREHDLGMINWGFVNGRSQTQFPWDSWQHPYTTQPPTVWFHDVLHGDGRPYREREAELLRAHAAAPRGPTAMAAP
jgi:hypothetical protein